MTVRTGSCLCGAVRYEVTGALRPVIACHCTQCRKQTGNYMSATAALDSDWHLTETRGLKWYRSSATAQRGFCDECGSTLFWKGDGRDYTAIAAGSLDGATGLPLAGHIFCDDAGDYYEISGGEYQAAAWSPNPGPKS
jgi:hypothetical protein